MRKEDLYSTLLSLTCLASEVCRDIMARGGLDLEPIFTRYRAAIASPRLAEREAILPDLAADLEDAYKYYAEVVGSAGRGLRGVKYVDKNIKGCTHFERISMLDFWEARLAGRVRAGWDVVISCEDGIIDWDN